MIISHCDTCGRRYRWFGRPWWAYICDWCGGAVLHPCEDPSRAGQFHNARTEADRFNTTGAAT